MNTCTVTEAKTHLSELLALVESGEEFVITRRGRLMAQLSLIRPLKRLTDWQAICACRESMPAMKSSATDLVREMRDASY
jgi:prevent-host-death family protein